MANDRILDVQGGVNFRELGGYATVDGHTVKWHKLLRTAGLANLTSSDLQHLTDYGVKTDVDFRSRDEQKQAPDKVPAGVTYQFTPVFPADDETDASASQVQLEERFSADDQAGYRHMLDVYEQMVTLPSAQQAYHDFLAELLRNEGDGQSVLFHCTAGKDRTGMAAFFVLSALGVDPQTIRHDYLMTNQTSADHINETTTAAAARGESAAFVTNIRALYTVNDDYFDTAMRLINTQYGGTLDYLHDVLGLSRGDLQTLKQLYLD
ncbi:tyrosine-protein phosphatase [Levilactobacillus tangyuanensis]|uniref:Tyrosine-protein phosphatase n=1 Tax=Levilactobacillus tangyuanensis TaxID=2486021 RepID=A0ABW1TMZ3_9LACO|nr:tyrosine-protein phosphatase [Levilactobacillus tangyuanensis]